MKKYERKIYEIIYQEERHFTAEEIHRELRKTEPKVVLATVYNNLNAMHLAKKIHKVSMNGMPDRYDRIGRHDHLVCQRCGKLSDICFRDFTQELETQLGGAILSYDLKVMVLCPECRSKQ